jgi:hypothetical protein
MLTLRNHGIRLVGPFLFVAFAGCGDSGRPVVPVTGTLTHKGQPVPNALVFFAPENGRPSQGPTDAEGHFKLSYTSEKDGAEVGKHKVWISSRQTTRPTTAKEQAAAIQGKRLPLSADLTAFFDKYSQTKSTVEVVVDKNTRDVKLDWD